MMTAVDMESWPAAVVGDLSRLALSATAPVGQAPAGFRKVHVAMQHFPDRVPEIYSKRQCD
jgi:hypothetical protein